MFKNQAELITSGKMYINENIMLNNKVTYISKISSKAICSVLISQKFLESTAKIKFRLNVTSIDTFTRYFQFKILHNYLAVNKNLYTWKIIY